MHSALRKVLRCAGGNIFPIVGTGTNRISLRSGEEVVCVTLVNVAHVPGLSYHLLSLRRIADAGNKYIGTREDIRIVLQNPAMNYSRSVWAVKMVFLATALIGLVKKTYTP